ncbi:DUF4232 domain-containing protein [Actinacidiphila oryziradicis]|uniref:DUF4232 domain-containing protein n=1 Tax=Actinacidiphila oryziradicis TaxID=2571141 RepID=UPI00145FCFBD|nr:DUF4232 domain-containing protein [Actinacidiphila oryziradicis]
MRTNRPAPVLLIASAALALALTPTLTACGGSGSGSGSVSVAESGAAPTSAAPSPSASASSSPSAGKNAGRAVDCTVARLTLVVKKVSSPVNHIVIEAVNKGSRACRLYEFPYMRFTADREEPVEPVEESNPHTIVTIAPGATAYAGVTIASADGSAAGSGHKAATLGLVLTGAGGGAVTDELHLPLPGGSLYVEDNAARVTYWENSLAEALTW